eukprot:GGOE01002271.1.p1 GENE.GGOE01002271.1~~GGOE01002271.1.p1  ORF type:complete len:178 (-),score=66.20 GGOE01002271.1:315-821(-)
MGGPCFVNGKAYHELDNFLVRPFVIDGLQYLSSEQYFQCMKFTDEGYREIIRATKSGNQCWELGNTRKFAIREDWEQVKVQVMYEANRAKFEQNADLRQVLVSTQGPIRAGGFPFWAEWNGILLERLREELREPSARDQALLDRRVAQMEEYRRGKHRCLVGSTRTAK